jgi:hypothetical protein
MKYIVYNIEKQAQERCDKAFIDMKCSDVNTTAYAIPVKHINEDLWAVCIDDNFKYLFTEEEISISEELTEDWFPKLELI